MAESPARRAAAERRSRILRASADRMRLITSGERFGELDTNNNLPAISTPAITFQESNAQESNAQESNAQESNAQESNAQESQPAQSNPLQLDSPQLESNPIPSAAQSNERSSGCSSPPVRSQLRNRLKAQLPPPPATTDDQLGDEQADNSLRLLKLRTAGSQTIWTARLLSVALYIPYLFLVEAFDPLALCLLVALVHVLAFKNIAGAFFEMVRAQLGRGGHEGLSGLVFALMSSMQGLRECAARLLASLWFIATWLLVLTALSDLHHVQ